MHEGLVPDLSLGTHFFNELVELNMLYVAYFVGRSGNRINTRFLMDEHNRLPELLENEGSWGNLVKVIDFSHGDGSSRGMYLNANALEQRSVLYVED